MTGFRYHTVTVHERYRDRDRDRDNLETVCINHFWSLNAGQITVKVSHGEVTEPSQISNSRGKYWPFLIIRRNSSLKKIEKIYSGRSNFEFPWLLSFWFRPSNIFISHKTAYFVSTKRRLSITVYKLTGLNKFFRLF